MIPKMKRKKQQLISVFLKITLNGKIGSRHANASIEIGNSMCIALNFKS